MANVTKFPTSAQSVTGAGTGGGTVAWSNINNIKADDGSVASITLSSSEKSYALLAGDFNFGISPLATIDGLVISMERYASLSNSIRDVTIRLTAYNGTYVLSDNKSNSDYWYTTLDPYYGNGVVTFGSPSDLWDRTDGISVNILNNLEFHLVCENNNYSSATGYVDYVKATVYYSIDGVKFSTSSLADIRDGSTQIQKIYHGSNQVFPDDDPNSISWSNVSSSTSPVTSSTQTFTGLNTSIPLKLSRSPGGGTLSYVLNGGSPVTISTVATSQYTNIVSISNNDTLSFRLVSTKAVNATVYVYHANKLNGTDTYELLAQFTLQKT